MLGESGRSNGFLIYYCAINYPPPQICGLTPQSVIMSHSSVDWLDSAVQNLLRIRCQLKPQSHEDPLGCLSKMAIHEAAVSSSQQGMATGVPHPKGLGLLTSWQLGSKREHPSSECSPKCGQKSQGSYDLASDVTPCHFCHILLVKNQS